ncbi:MAG: hypothetical protein UV63_C0010G0006 [Microgenomates group bacterium GW2011_GWC1_43_11]|uniref:Uncharacterized protein n=1 Tax=Candidatus Gottesmanbacteria bacterium GW2011_GWA1_44_24b TaxID=1618437 RepID=A0A0G1IN39_9BACT|nr:MAG: hypothetical protein UV63_C0010G0006 [Microgenomates group bacterium GW2011_GWC1_43_11]KKT60348.1 MAG: hypothetical protein UW52_C0027G0020 [Candidatus Gottesmanbacteria bacterium GW2011_GWA1_44_24b]HCM82327.1 hypothetical protein [Patescibacteria group bacterium]
MEQYPAVSPSLFRTLTAQKKMVLVGAGILIFFAYVGLNIGIWRYARNSGKAAQTVAQENGGAAGDENAGPPPAGGLTPTITPTPRSTPTPTPRPTGPGPYACDPLGICNHYGDAQRKECPKTYADDHCLDECSDIKVQCPK